MARSLLGEIAHQIFGTPPKSNHHKGSSSSHNSNKTSNKDYEKQMYKLKQAAFENKKAYEINKCKLKSKGLI